METIEYKNINFTAWDVGGRGKIVSFYSVIVGLLANTLSSPSAPLVSALLPEHRRGDLSGGQQ